MPRLMGIQAEGSVACCNVWKADTEKITPINAQTVADSISAGIPRDGVRTERAVCKTGGAYLAMTDAEILAAIPVSARRAAVFSEPEGAAAYAGLVKAVRQDLVKSDETIVCVITGNGLKDITSAMKAVSPERSEGSVGEETRIEPTLEVIKSVLP